RREGDQVTCSEQARKRALSGTMLGVLQQLRGNEKAGIESMDHARPSSISPSKSSSEVNGRSTAPTLTGGMSRMLCGREPPLGGLANAAPGASTVTSCPSGRRTPSSSTTTPFRTQPRATIEHHLIKLGITNDSLSRGQQNTKLSTHYAPHAQESAAVPCLSSA